ncbi:MAG: nucleotidyltransferase domain-containing protein [Dehalococcoidia bacterium]|nr:nucleotidyltransferase domain-containing protein [Dehalococcoidia bacterium]
MKKHTFTIEEIKAIIAPVAQEYGVKRIALFGSYARGEASPKSDIDFHLIDIGGVRGYFKLCCFRDALKNSLGVNVDVLTTGAIDSEILETVSKDEVLGFER